MSGAKFPLIFLLSRVDDVLNLLQKKNILIRTKFGISGKSNTPLRSSQELKPQIRNKAQIRRRC